MLKYSNEKLAIVLPSCAEQPVHVCIRLADAQFVGDSSGLHALFPLPGHDYDGASKSFRWLRQRTGRQSILVEQEPIHKESR